MDADAMDEFDDDGGELLDEVGDDDVGGSAEEFAEADLLGAKLSDPAGIEDEGGNGKKKSKRGQPSKASGRAKYLTQVIQPSPK